MNPFCSDRDLLIFEPALFLGAAWPCSILCGQGGASLSGTTLTAQDTDFNAAGVAAGMVANIWTTTAAEGIACEIVSVDSPTTLTVSALRADRGGPAVAPLAGGENLVFAVRTYQPQIQAATEALDETRLQMCSSAGIGTAEFADPGAIRLAAAYGALESIFIARSRGGNDDGDTAKARQYRAFLRESKARLRVIFDADNDGIAERMLTLGNVTLRRV